MNEMNGFSSSDSDEHDGLSRKKWVLLVSILAIAFVLVVVIYHGLTCRGKLWQSQSASKLDVWFASHVFLYAILGWLFPEEWVLLIGVGIVWEVLEWIVHRLARSPPKSMPGYRFIQCKTANEPLLYEKWTDLLANMAGLCIGIGAAWWWYRP